jgi:hypothetical protein
MAWLKDLDSRYIAVNEQFSKTSGMKAGRYRRQDGSRHLGKGIRRPYTQDDLEVIQSGTRRRLRRLQDHKDGREYWVETVKTPSAIRRESDRHHRHRPRHHRTETGGDRTRTLITELEPKNAELERFTYTVSHDLKSPLVPSPAFSVTSKRMPAQGISTNSKKTSNAFNKPLKKCKPC